MKLYYTDQDVNDFSEKYIKRIKTYQNGNIYSFQTNLYNVKNIRLDPLEGDYISIRIEIIEINGVKQSFIIPFSIEKDGWFDILSSDPQILIMQDHIVENVSLKVTFKMKYINIDDTNKNYLELTNRLASLQNEMAYYKTKYPVIFKSRNTIFSKVIKKIIARL